MNFKAFIYSILFIGGLLITSVSAQSQTYQTVTFKSMDSSFPVQGFKIDFFTEGASLGRIFFSQYRPDDCLVCSTSDMYLKFTPRFLETDKIYYTQSGDYQNFPTYGAYSVRSQKRPQAQGYQFLLFDETFHLTAYHHESFKSQQVVKVRMIDGDFVTCGQYCPSHMKTLSLKEANFVVTKVKKH